MRISDWSSDVCSSDLGEAGQGLAQVQEAVLLAVGVETDHVVAAEDRQQIILDAEALCPQAAQDAVEAQHGVERADAPNRSEERRVGKECVSKCRARWLRYN